MKNDQMSSGRRAVLRGAVGLGIAATGWILSGCTSHTSDRRPAAATPPAAGPPPARTARARVRAAAAYRLRPMTAYGPPKAVPARPPVRSQPFLQLSGIGRGMVLTFDDGPDPRYTPEVLRILRRYDVQAMFFVVGTMASEHRDLLREMANDGHVVANHSWSHPLIPRLSPDGIRDQLGRTSDIIANTLGESPRWYRAPYGAWNGHSFRIGAELGMEPLAWTVDTLDWRTGVTAGRITKTVLDGAGPGVVVLSHDAGGNRRPSVVALRSYLPKLLDSGYRITVPPSL
jgi:peptidoglycan-N-acetylglucosamine deacetylase